MKLEGEQNRDYFEGADITLVQIIKGALYDIHIIATFVHPCTSL